MSKKAKPVEIVKIPEIKVHGLVGRLFYTINKIPRLVWLAILVALLLLLFFLTPRQIWKLLWLSLQKQEFLFILVLLFAFITLSLVWSIGQKLDVWVFMFLNMRGKRPHWIDKTMLIFTQLGNFIFAVILSLAVFIKGDRLLAFEIILGVLSLSIIIQIIKITIHRTRPYIKLKDIRIIGSHASGHSFPSGHTGQVFLIMTMLVEYYNVNILLSVILYSVALLVGITRIYVGMHYPRDVLGGAFLGTAWGFLGGVINSQIPFLK